MGTRNLTIVKLGSKIHGQYGQWDGYPSGNGVKVLDFLQDQFEEPAFKAKFEAAVFLTEDKDVEKAYRAFEKAGVHRHNNPFDRDMGAGILAYIQKTHGAELFNSVDFAADSLFCEWAYMVDLDNRMLRVFEGFNQEPLADGQFFKDVLPVTMGKQSTEYFPIKEIVSLTFEAVATISKEDFLTLCKRNSRYPED